MKRKFLLIFLCSISFVSCGGKGVVNPNYQAQLASHERLAKQFAQADRAIFRMEVGDQAVTLPPGVKFVVNAQPSEPVYPAMFRDYDREANLQFWSSIVNSVVQPGLGGLFNWLGQREDRKMFDGIFTGRQGIRFDAVGDINFSGGIGDYGLRGYSSSNTTNTTRTSTVTPAPVFNTPVINKPVVVQPVIPPPVVVPPVIK